MKNWKQRFLALLLIGMLILSGTACSTETTAPDSSAGGGSSVPGTSSTLDRTAESMIITTSQLAADLQSQYAADSAYIYLDPIGEVPQDHVFSAAIDFAPADKGIADLTEIVDVFIDSELTLSVQPVLSYDEANGQIVVSPPKKAAMSFDKDGISYNAENQWGLGAVYYLVNYIEEDGARAEKPYVSIFTIENEHSAPVLEFGRDENGLLNLSWTPVENAEKYIVGAVSHGFSSDDLYSAAHAVVTDTRYTDDATMEMLESEYPNYRYDVQSSFLFEGYYFVVAVVNGELSPASNLLSVDPIRHTLPTALSDDNTRSFDDIKDLPAFMTVRMCDNSEVHYPVTYDMDNLHYMDGRGYLSQYADMSEEEMTAEFTEEELSEKLCVMDFTADGTLVGSFVLIRNCDNAGFEAELAMVLERNEEMKGKTGTSKDVDFSYGDEDSSTEPQGEEKEFTNADTLSATNALSAYIALHLVSGEEYIDLSGFPQARDVNIVKECFYEALYQNPMVLSVDSIASNGDYSVLKITYGQDRETLLSKQAELRAEVDRVVAEIIDDSMSDLEKELAINDYLCTIAEYDDAALENALENNMIPDESFNDSFTAYGVLINKVGVCASYSAAYKLLAQAAGLDCVVVTGYLNGDLPHAWNRVNIDGQWMSIDVTNNDTAIFPNYLLNIPDSAAATVLVEDNLYVCSDARSQFTGEEEDLEYYRLTEGYYPLQQAGAEAARQFEQDGTVLLRTDYDVSEDELTLILQDFSKAISSESLAKMEDAKFFFYLGMLRIE